MEGLVLFTEQHTTQDHFETMQTVFLIKGLNCNYVLLQMITFECIVTENIPKMSTDAGQNLNSCNK